jgi:hypothetical protein
MVAMFAGGNKQLVSQFVDKIAICRQDSNEISTANYYIVILKAIRVIANT